MKLICLKSAQKSKSFDVYNGIKIRRLVPISIEPGRSLLQFFTTNCLIKTIESFECLMTSYNKLHSKLKEEDCTRLGPFHLLVRLF